MLTQLAHLLDECLKAHSKDVLWMRFLQMFLKGTFSIIRLTAFFLFACLFVFPISLVFCFVCVCVCFCFVLSCLFCFVVLFFSQYQGGHSSISPDRTRMETVSLFMTLLGTWTKSKMSK